MNHRDIIDFDQISVKFIEDEEAIKFLHNPIYRPVLLILREGIKTAEEIEEALQTKREYKVVTVKAPSLKTIYRHLKVLTKAGLVTQAGTRGTQRLFARTAKFFYLKSSEKGHLAPEKIKAKAKLLSMVLQIGLDIPKPPVDCLGSLIEKLYKFEADCGEDLFTEHADEMADFLGDVPLEDLQSIVDTYHTIKLLLRKDELTKDFKECLKIS